MKALSGRDKAEFTDWIAQLIKQHYKGGLFWRARLRWKLVKEWNHRYSYLGIPANVRDILGEDKATRLFQEIAENIVSNPDLLEKALSHTADTISGPDEKVDESLQKAALHTLKQVEALMSKAAPLEATVEYLATNAAFLTNPSNEYERWFIDEVNSAANSSSRFKLLCLTHIHGSVSGAVKHANPNTKMPEISIEVLQRTKEIYEKVLEIEQQQQVNDIEDLIKSRFGINS